MLNQLPIKLYTVVVFNLRKGENPGLKKIKGDNYLCRTWVLCVMRLTVLVLVKLSKVIGKPMTLYRIKVFKHCAELLFFPILSELNTL